ncbi:MAG: alpha/beta hydrolase [Candidatus Glassbacteria bacterium]|nr:alpha/beta hydrolase [Candidatus Glassbacteria bacterium]
MSGFRTKALRIVIWPAGSLALGTAVAFLFAEWYRAADHTGRLLERRGCGFEVVEKELAEVAGRRAVAFSLTDNLGRVSSGCLSLPATVAEPLPAVLILGGHGTGARAVELVKLDRPAVLCGMDYPPIPEHRVHPARFPSLLFSLDSLVTDAVGMAFTAIDYLSAHSAVDSTRITVLGASFGVPFAVIAGLDPQVDGMVLIYGGAGMERVIEWNLRGKIRSGPLRRFVSYILGTFAAPFEPSSYIGEFSPRPLLIVNGSGDTKIPVESACQLYAAAGEPKEQVWVQGEHIHPSNRQLIDSLTAGISGWMVRQGLL